MNIYGPTMLIEFYFVFKGKGFGKMGIYLVKRSFKEFRITVGCAKIG